MDRCTRRSRDRRTEPGWPNHGVAVARLYGHDHPLLHARQHDLERDDAGSRGRTWTTGAPFFVRIFLVALEQLDRDALRAADEADADSRPNGRRLLRELHALGLDLGGHRVNVFYRQPEMIEPLIGRLRRCVDAVVGRDRRDEHVGTAELDVDPPGATDDHAAEDIFKPGRSRLRVGTAQVDMIPRDYRHRRSPRLPSMRRLPRDLASAAMRSILAVAFRRCQPSMPDLTRTALCVPIFVVFGCNHFGIHGLT